MIVPFLKSECNYFREIIIRGLGRINIEGIRDLVEEILPLIKESNDKREKVRRMKKRDQTRLAIVRIFELMAEQRTLGKRIIDTTQKPKHQLYLQLHQQIQQQHQNNEQQLLKTFHDYVDGIQAYLDQESEKYSDILIQTRLHFSLFMHKLIDSVPSERRGILFAGNTRYNLFYLCDKWSGRFSLMQHQHLTQSQNQNSALNSSSGASNSGILSLSRFNLISGQSVPTSSSATANSMLTGSQQPNRSHPNQLYFHQNHYHHHKCYHFYEEVELAATKACASLLCCDDTLELLSSTTHGIIYEYFTSWI